jgi:hypothetical protein
MQYDRIPRKYHLWWDSAGKAIMIHVHKDCLKFIPHPVQKNWPLVQVPIDEHGLDELFDSFSGNLKGDSFGFNHAIRKTNEHDEYLEFQAPLPHVKIRTDFACEDCGGKGRRLEEYASPEDKCLHCNGSGKKYILDWRPAFTLTSSLGLLFELLNFKEDTSAAEKQHATVCMISQYGMHGSSMGGCFGADIIDYIRSHPPELNSFIVKEITKAMQLAHSWMFTYDKYDRDRIRTECHDDQIGLTVPGDACGINTSFHERNDGGGSEYSCHNVDSPLQSLTLLTGIASLIGQASFYIEARQEKQKVNA